MIEIATLKTYDSPTHTVSVQLAGSVTTYLDDVPVSKAIDAADMSIGDKVILAVPGNNLKDAVIIAVFTP